jgi:glucosamine-6-phosphate deaminase
MGMMVKELWSPCGQRVRIFPTASAASQSVAQQIADAVRSQPAVVLGLATGGTPVETYRDLVRMHREQGLDFSAVTTFNLDEYVGLPVDHACSYRRFMNEQLFDQLNIDPSHTHLPDGRASDLVQQAADYEADILAAGGIDLQLLGIGHNGHIAFNEPGSPIDSRTRVVELTDQTIENNARFFDSIDDVPRRAITMGIGTILESRAIVLLATGTGKASAVARAIEGSRDESHPASLLQAHSQVTWVLDEAAASNLSAT